MHIYVQMCICVYMCVYMHVVAEVGMGLPLSLSASFFEAGSLAQFELTEWARTHRMG